MLEYAIVSTKATNNFHCLEKEKNTLITVNHT